MKLTLDIHPIQTDILRVLLFTPQARFAALNPGKLPTDQFTFHLKRVQALDLVTKTPTGYTLTALGKEFANRLDTDTNLIERQAKLGVLVAPMREVNGQREYLLQRRLKQPYWGFCGFLTGKIRWGETILEAGARELEEETGLTATSLEIGGLQHKLDHLATGELLEDKYFYLVRAQSLQGTLTASFEGGENFWLTRDHILALPQLFRGVDGSLDMADATTLQLTEASFTYTDDEY